MAGKSQNYQADDSDDFAEEEGCGKRFCWLWVTLAVVVVAVAAILIICFTCCKKDEVQNNAASDANAANAANAAPDTQQDQQTPPPPSPPAQESTEDPLDTADFVNDEADALPKGHYITVKGVKKQVSKAAFDAWEKKQWQKHAKLARKFNYYEPEPTEQVRAAYQKDEKKAKKDCEDVEGLRLWVAPGGIHPQDGEWLTFCQLLEKYLDHNGHGPVIDADHTKGSVEKQAKELWDSLTK